MSSRGREVVKKQVPVFTTHLADLRSDQRPGSGWGRVMDGVFETRA